MGTKSNLDIQRKKVQEFRAALTRLQTPGAIPTSASDPLTYLMQQLEQRKNDAERAALLEDTKKALEHGEAELAKLEEAWAAQVNEADDALSQCADVGNKINRLAFELFEALKEYEQLTNSVRGKVSAVHRDPFEATFSSTLITLPHVQVGNNSQRLTQMRAVDMPKVAK
ncbi:MAG: hypothetical protein AAFU78_15400 [Cyanobacteria bacterium J06633_2]